MVGKEVRDGPKCVGFWVPHNQEGKGGGGVVEPQEAKGGGGVPAKEGKGIVWKARNAVTTWREKMVSFVCHPSWQKAFDKEISKDVL